MHTENKKGKIYGLLGRNIDYSFSPTMHNAAFKHFGIQAEYVLFDIEEEDVSKFISGIMSNDDTFGINVTVPYKLKVKNILEDVIDQGMIDSGAQVLGAVNTVQKTDGKLIGFNTDGPGFYESLTEEAGFSARDKIIFICGIGGAGGTICKYLADLKEERPSFVYVCDIDTVRRDEVVTQCNQIAGVKISEGVASADPDNTIADCDLLINATPLGTKEGDPAPFPLEGIDPSKVVYDLVYARETELMKCAGKKGAKAVNGLGMLINQGAIAFNIWTGMPLDETKEVMRKAIKQRLEQTK